MVFGSFISDLVKNTKTESVFYNFFVTFLCSDSGKVMNGINRNNRVVLSFSLGQLRQYFQKKNRVMKKDLHKAYFALGIVSFFWGTTFIASRIGAQHMPGLFISGIRQFVSGSILVAFFLIRGHHIHGRDILKKISIQSIFLLCIANGLLTWSVEYIS